MNIEKLQWKINRIEISNLDDVPDNKFLDDIWFYMDIRLNFARLMRETRETKLKQQLNFLEYVSTKTAPDNALILYFFGYIEKKIYGSVSTKLKTRLQAILVSSEYWRIRFEHFNFGSVYIHTCL